ncbi:hypothetical protein CRYUN_Cryun09bG0211500 [Craigia yunnanensis]
MGTLSNRGSHVISNALVLVSQSAMALSYMTLRISYWYSFSFIDVSLEIMSAYIVLQMQLQILRIIFLTEGYCNWKDKKQIEILRSMNLLHLQKQ